MPCCGLLPDQPWQWSVIPRPTCGGRSPTRAAAGHDLGTPSHASLGGWRRGAGDAHDAPLPSRTNPLHGTCHAFTTRLASFTCFHCNQTSDQFIYIEVCLLIFSGHVLYPLLSVLLVSSECNSCKSSGPAPWWTLSHRPQLQIWLPLTCILLFTIYSVILITWRHVLSTY